MISIFIDHKLERLTREIRYTFDFIFEVLGFGYRFVNEPSDLKATDIVLLYSLNEPSEKQIKTLAKHYVTISIVCDSQLYDPKAMNAESLSRRLKSGNLMFETKIISSKGFNNIAENYIDEGYSGGKINFDPVANIFYHLSSTERSYYSNPKGDERFNEEDSVFYSQRMVPVVDCMLWLIESMIKEHAMHKKIPLAQKMHWPQNQNGAVLLSHTVNSLQKWDYKKIVLSIADDIHMLITFKFRQLLHTFWAKFRYFFTNIELYWNFEDFQELERENGFRSTFFLGTDKGEELDYSLEDPDLQEEIQNILKKGNEIGLLLPNDKFNKDDMLSRKHVMQHQVDEELIGIRQLNYVQNNEILELYDKINPLYAQSAAFRESSGYFYGTAFPFYPWVGAKANYLCLPMSFTDRYLWLTKHRILGLDDAKAKLKQILNTVNRTKGIMSVDLSLASYHDIHYVHKLYSYFLELVNSSGAWVCTAKELCQWWKKRSKVTIEEDEYEISLYFDDDIEHFSLQCYNINRIKEIAGTSGKIEGNLVRYNSVKAKSVSVIRFKS